jgi:hypothetical protein
VLSEKLMQRILTLSVSALAMTATGLKAEETNCGRSFNLASAYALLAHPSNVKGSHDDGTCRIYGSLIFEMAVARQTASRCRQGIDRDRQLAILDAKLNSLNDLMADRCSPL